MPPRRRAKKAAAKRKIAKRPSKMRKTIAPVESACLKETLVTDPIVPNTPYELNYSLGLFPRALDVADNYQQYRISRVEVAYTPLYDTFGANNEPTSSNAQITVPYLYTKQQIMATPAAYNLSFLTAQGARPIRLDDKTIRHKYRPVIHTATADATGLKDTRAVKSPWLSTHQNGTAVMDDTLHYTHNFWIQQDVKNANFPAVCSLEITVFFEFKKPWDLATASPTNGIGKITLGKSVQNS